MVNYLISGLREGREGFAKKFFHYQAGMGWDAAQAAVTRMKDPAHIEEISFNPTGTLKLVNSVTGLRHTFMQECVFCFDKVTVLDGAPQEPPKPVEPPKPAPKPDWVPAPSEPPVKPVAPSNEGLGKTVPEALGLDAVINATIDRRIGERVEAAIASALEGRITVRHEIQRDQETIVLDEHLHPAFNDVLQCASLGINIMLKGPMGCGKTTLAAQVAKALGLQFGTISCTGGMTESQITGRLLPTGDHGKFVYHETDFVRIYHEGGVFLFDEMDAADPNVMIVINSALANGGMHIETRGASGLDTYVNRHPDCVIICAANTFGMGADAVYVGRNQLDGATMDRFVGGIIEMDYDTALERDIGNPEIVANVHIWRKMARDAKLNRGISTRMVIAGTKLAKAGMPFNQIKSRLLTGWKRDELSRIGL